jgi:YfiH family protein
MEVDFTRCESFAGIDGLAHAIFTRHGGVSAAPFATLNQSLAVPDDPGAVRENRRRALAALEWPGAAVISITQVHGSDVYRATGPVSAAESLPAADVLITDTPGLALFMRYADCAPILLVDPVRRAVALAHAGWRGTVAGVAARAVQALAGAFGSRAEDLRAAIGPAIGPCCYAVGADVLAPARARWGDDPALYVAQPGGATHFNLWEANRRELAAAGVRSIEVAGVCTACHHDDYFSHRAERGRTGRFGVYLGWR